MIFIDENNVCDQKIIIDGQNHIHIARVLRSKIGEKIVVNDEKMLYTIRIEEITKSETICDIIEKSAILDEVSPRISVYMSATKGDKMELVTQKVTELGASKIIPFTSARSIVKFDEKSKIKKSERLQIIAREACNQCKSLFLTKVSNVLSFSEMAFEIKSQHLVVVLYENEQNVGLKEVISSQKFDEISVIIGPEGGFEEYEIEKIKQVGGVVASLGKRILRAETAPIAVVSAIMYEKNNLS